MPIKQSVLHQLVSELVHTWLDSSGHLTREAVGRLNSWPKNIIDGPLLAKGIQGLVQVVSIRVVCKNEIYSSEGVLRLRRKKCDRMIAVTV